MDRGDAAPASSPRGYRLGPWSASGVAELTATGDSAQETLQVGLNGVLAAARGERPGIAARDAEGEPAAVPIRGDGPDLAALFADLAADLLAQLDAHGVAMDQVRLDGLLPTDEGLTAWGYAIGIPESAPPPTGIALAGRPTISLTDGRDVLRCALRRAAPRA